MSKDKKYGNELKSEDWSHHIGYSTQRTMQMCRHFAENIRLKISQTQQTHKTAHSTDVICITYAHRSSRG